MHCFKSWYWKFCPVLGEKGYPTEGKTWERCWALHSQSNSVLGLWCMLLSQCGRWGDVLKRKPRQAARLESCSSSAPAFSALCPVMLFFLLNHTSLCPASTLQACPQETSAQGECQFEELLVLSTAVWRPAYWSTCTKTHGAWNDAGACILVFPLAVEV